MQQSRRSTPYPSTWEIPVAAGMAVVLVLVLAAHAARALANLLAGAGWTFTPQAELFTTLPALLAGDARAGLPAGPGATPTLLHTCLVLVEADRHHPHGVGGPGRDAPVGPGTGARHGHPRPKRTPCSVPAGSAGSRRSSAPTCTPPGCLDCDGWSHARWGGGSGSPTNRAAATCGCRGTAPPASSARKGPARPWTCSSPPCSPPPAPPWSPSPRPMTCCCPSGTAPPGTARVSCWTRSGSPRDCPSWSGTRWPGAWTRWSPRSAPRRSPPAPSPAPAPEARVTTPPGSTPPRPPRSSRATSTPPP